MCGRMIDPMRPVDFVQGRRSVENSGFPGLMLKGLGS